MIRYWSEVLAWWRVDNTTASCIQDVALGHIHADSRAVSSNDLFIALGGLRVHGVAFSEQVKRLGAWVISDQPGQFVDLCVPELANRLGDFLNWFYDDPSQQLTLIGITGTNGKTSTSHYAAQWLTGVGRRVALMGTVGNGLWGQLSCTTHTTPDAPSIYRQLAQWRDLGVDVVIMEVSSHAIDQQRIAGLSFAVLALTQVTRDHLDYHGSVADYRLVKQRLFTDWASAMQVINLDDPVGKRLSLACTHVMGYSRTGLAEVQCVQADAHPDGVQVQLMVSGQSWQGVLPLYGLFNVENVLCALGCVLSLGYRFEAITPFLEETRAVIGRMQPVRHHPVVLVDYAHTPDALEKVLVSLRAHCSGSRLRVVFGAGGNRDVGKRPLMGTVAALGADVVIITDDNPRDESPEQIARDILSGMYNAAVVRYIPDRQTAICTAILESHVNDVVLIAGKGHESYQEVAGMRLSFSDIDAVAQCKV